MIDKKQGVDILIDTGAGISVWPRSKFTSAVWDPGKTLVAVNGSAIKTYGQRNIKFNLGPFSFHHQFTLADVPGPVLGWEFLQKHKVDILWAKNTCTL